MCEKQMAKTMDCVPWTFCSEVIDLCVVEFIRK